MQIKTLPHNDYLNSDDQLVVSVFEKVKTPSQRSAAMNFFKETWTPKYKQNPLPKFLEQAENIGSINTDISALKAFEKFKMDFAYFENIVEEMAIALDQYIQHQIDVALW